MPVALITGITGQTGSYLCEHLLLEGWAVHGLIRDADDLATSFAERSPAAELHVGDLTSHNDVHGLVAQVRPDAIFNLAGMSSVAKSWSDPRLTGLVNGLGVASILEAALRLREDVKRPVAFVQASSAEIFGRATEVPQNESTPVRPANPYGASKAYAHHLVGVYRGVGLEASSCILYNHESPRRPEGFVTRKITQGVARIALGLESRLVLGNLDAERDWGWAPDYARAIALAAGRPGDYVIATGERHSVREFVHAAFWAAGIENWEQHVHQDPAFMRPQDPPQQVGDASRAREVLGWQPKVSFTELVRRMVEHDLASLAETR